ncbi:TPA: hypothetical protein DDW69_01470 [candidate division CPR2 bacterium]|uniref:Cell envelope-related transcriptional attenuator n=1 Tax=candidate division CPR2 bacterium GW2011_GWC1_41_48 TaxID=1618344 RepID=A0A0G0YJJ2_UNCC2|nr:MAG: cell envelope-related function transcriptional attenuator, LytR/CpsA family protein, nonfunctional [candidate division CPR2 bacterium GW2011_GWC2_39_35]KKS09691.1 MAG: hypothetical protein UU65_C0001G0096 [candidate division CPR2 bacterium GW2011_GWC1_41_48]HBG81489.1 hypothetical protein [candidate division CPR2 bacterium]HCL99546.1 hypothetical protein [candidate division CPR2 bacterium]
MIKKGTRVSLENSRQTGKSRLDNLEKKKKNSRKKKILIAVIMIFLVATGFLGWRVWGAFNKIFSDGMNPLSILANLKPTSLAGESEGRTNILLLGTGDKDWPGGDLTDTIMVASINPKTSDVALISIPRDFYVKIEDHGWDKINSAYVYGEQNQYQGGGAALTSKTVSDVLDIPIHYYAKIDFTAFKKAIDSVGGIDITPSENLYDPYYPGGTVSFKGGRNYHMNGELALKYARSRQTTSDFDRARRQQEVLVALKEKSMSLGTLSNPKTVLELIDILGDHIRTSLKPNEMKRLADIVNSINKDKVISAVIDGEKTKLATTGNVNGASVVLPVLGKGKYADIQDYVQNIFTADNKVGSLTDEKAKIMVQNGAGIPGLAATATENLTKKEYLIVGTENADKSTYTKTKIIDYANGQKKLTIKSLEDYFSITSVKQTTSTANYDILIIIGQDYEPEN